MSNVVTLPAVVLGTRIPWQLSFLDANGAAVDLTSATVAVSAEANNQAWSNPTITATLTSATTAPQVTAVLDTADYGSLAAPTILLITGSATISGEVVSRVQFLQPITPAVADNTALVDTDWVAQAVLGVAWSSLSTADKVLVDSAVVQANDRVGQLAQHFMYAGSNAIPDAWKDWAKIEAEIALSRFRRPERLNELRAEREDKIDAALSSFSNVSNDSLSILGQTFNLQNVTRYIVAHAARLKPRLFVDTAVVHQTFQQVVNDFWNSGNWIFRRRPIQMYVNPIAISGGGWTESTKTITGIDSSSYTHASGVVLHGVTGTNVIEGDYLVASKPGATSITLTSSLSRTAGNLANADIAGTIVVVTIAGLGDSEVFDSLGTRELWPTDGSSPARWMLPDDHARRRSYGVNAYNDRTFRFENHGTYLSWRFDPTPNEALVYTAQAIIRGPTLPSGSTAGTDTAQLALIPAECHTYLRDKTLATVLENHGRPVGSELQARIGNSRSALLAQFVSQGAPAHTIPPTDVYRDYSYVAGGFGDAGGW